MNFIDYCIYTKNYSTLSAINDYTKSFGIFSRLKRKVNNFIDDKIVSKRTGLTRSDINTLRKRGGKSTFDLLKLSLSKDNSEVNKMLDPYKKSVKSIKQAHKTGMLDGLIHDPKGKYVNGLDKFIRHYNNEVSNNMRMAKYDTDMNESYNNLRKANVLDEDEYNNLMDLNNATKGDMKAMKKAIKNNSKRGKVLRVLM